MNQYLQKDKKKCIILSPPPNTPIFLGVFGGGDKISLLEQKGSFLY